MTDTERKALQRAHEAAGNIAVRCWVPERRKAEVDAMAQEAEQAIKEREDGVATKRERNVTRG